MKNNKVEEKSVLGMISIIIPVYNAEDYIKKCLNSIIEQDYKNIEVILINDGSKDKSGEICDKYAEKDKRIRVIHKENQGPSAARNDGLKESNGEFIFFIDADDYIEKDTFSLLIDNIKKNKTDLAISDFQKISDGKQIERNDIIFEDDKLLDRKELVKYSRMYLKKPNRYLLFAFSWGRLFKSSIIKKNKLYFDETLHTFEDVAFNFDYLSHITKVSFIKKRLYNHLIHDNYSSATMTISGNPKKMFGYLKALKNIGSYLKGKVPEMEIRKDIGHAYIYLTIIQFVRTCGQINRENKKMIHDLIKNIIRDKRIKDNIKHYSPSKEDSKILPLLMKLGLIGLIIKVCRYKAGKRYKKN